MPTTRSMANGAVTGIDRIGDIAGKVWHALNSKGSITLTQLSKEVDAPRDLVMQAVGWLAREGKLSVEEKGRTRKVTLT